MCSRFVVLPLVLTISAAAQQTLSLGEAVSQALGAHPVLAAGESRIAVSEGYRLQAGLRPNPRLVFQSENMRTYGNPGYRYWNDSDIYVYLEMPYETGGKRGRHVDTAESELKRARLEKDLLASQIAARVKQAYWTALAADRIRRLLDENVKTFHQIVEYHQIRVREGAMAEVDLIRVRLESERLQVEANTAALEAERARIQLFREMGQAQFPEATFTEPLEDVSAPRLDVDENRALDARPEMRLAREAVSLALARQRLEQASTKPNFDFIAGYKRTAGFSTALAGVQVNLPVSNDNRGNIAAAAAGVTVAQRNLAATEALIRAEVKAAVTEFEIRRRQLTEPLRALRDQAQETSRIAQAAYREGGADLLRLLDAERTRIESQLLYHRLLADYKRSIAALETALGVMP